jgi:hypothetical protein
MVITESQSSIPPADIPQPRDIHQWSGRETDHTARKGKQSIRVELEVPKIDHLTTREKLTVEVQQAFFDTLAMYGSVAKACDVAGVRAVEMYRMKKRYKEFSDMWDEAAEAGAFAMEDEARRRAYTGVETPVYQGKELVGHKKVYSDLLMIFLLKGKFPDKYRDRWEGKVAPNGNDLAGVDLSVLSEKELKTVRGVMEKARQAALNKPTKD